MGGSARKRRRKAALLIRRKKHNVAGETAVEKPLGGKVPNQTFPPSLQIAQKARDSHFPTAATTAGLRLHFQCLDGRPQGYIFKWLDAAVIPADQIRSRDYIAVCRRSRGHGWCARIEGPSTATSAGNRSYVYGSDAFLPDYNGAHEWR